jgi:hypothetical protein
MEEERKGERSGERGVVLTWILSTRPASEVDDGENNSEKMTR